MTRAFFPYYDLVLELPSLNYIKKMRSVLALCARILAVIKIGNTKTWKQPHTDETTCRQTSIVNVVMGILTNDNELRTICLSGSFIMENRTTKS